MIPDHPGGALSLFAAVLVAVRAFRERDRETKIRKLEHERELDIGRHKQAYSHDIVPEGIPRPINGMTADEYAAFIWQRYESQYIKLTGRKPSDPVQFTSTADHMIRELGGPAVLAGLGIIVGTVGAVMSLFLTP